MADSGLSITDIEREIRRQAREADELRVQGRADAEEIKDYAVEISPVVSGEYAGAWHIEPRSPVDGMPAWKLINDSEIAEKVEFGTGPAADHNARPQGGSSPEHAIRAKTAAHFAGTEESVE